MCRTFTLVHLTSPNLHSPDQCKSDGIIFQARDRTGDHKIIPVNCKIQDVNCKIQDVNYKIQCQLQDTMSITRYNVNYKMSIQ